MYQYVDIKATPTITSGSAYASGNQIGGVMTLVGAGPGAAEGCDLSKIVIIDKDNQKSAIDILLFNDNPTVASADKANVNITTAELLSKCIGVIPITAASYVTLTGSSNAVAAYNAPNMPYAVKPSNTVATKVNTLYAVAVSRGTPTYTTTSSLQFNFQFIWFI